MAVSSRQALYLCSTFHIKKVVLHHKIISGNRLQWLLEKSDEKLGSDAGVNPGSKICNVTEELGLECQRSVAWYPYFTLIKSSIEIQFMAFQVQIKTLKFLQIIDDLFWFTTQMRFEKCVWSAPCQKTRRTLLFPCHHPNTALLVLLFLKKGNFTPL